MTKKLRINENTERGLLILGNLEDELLAGNEERTMIGVRDYLMMAGKPFHLVFHSIPGVLAAEEKLGEFLRIPLLNYKHPEMEDSAKIAMTEFFRQHPSITIYSLRIFAPAICEQPNGTSREITGSTFKFYELEDLGVGISIKSKNDYFVARELFERNIPNWDKKRVELDQLKKEIDASYLS